MNKNQQVQSVAAPGTQPDRATMPGVANFGEQAHPRILRIRDVIGVVGLKKSSIYGKIANGAFPRPIKVGGVRASGWLWVANSHFGELASCAYRWGAQELNHMDVSLATTGDITNCRC